ncbi:MAG: hypothetical protein NVSMB9_36080 [Isosphaeraceae bacterium]
MQDSSTDLNASLLRGDIENAPLPEPERALLRFVKLVTETAYRTTDASVEALREQGWTDAQIAECVYITALFAFFNRVADAFGIDDPGYDRNPPPRGGEPLRKDRPPESPA